MLSKKTQSILFVGIFSILALAWVAFGVRGIHLSDAEWGKILPGFQEAEAEFGPSPAGRVRLYVGIILVLITGLGALAALLLRFKDKLTPIDIRARIISATVAVAVTFVLFEHLVGHGFEAYWYRVSVMMTHPETVPVFGQRLLMVWPAMLLKHFVPRLTYIQAYLAIQGLGLVLVVYVIGEFSALFVGRELKFLGQILLAAFLLATQDSYVGHDVGVLFTYTFCYLFLYKRQYALFLLAFCVGMLNHQNILLLIPTAVAIMWPPKEGIKTVAWVAGAATIAYFSIQFVLNHTIPLAYTHEMKIWFNMRQIAELHRTMIFGAMILIPWYVAGAFAFRSADPFLKRASLLLPMQIGIYIIYGQLNEARLFNGFMPILIAIYLCYIRERFLAKETPLSVSSV